MVKIKYRRDHWILIAFTLEDTNWNLRTQVVYLVMNWKFSLQQKQKHQKNCATCWSVTSLMRVFYRSKRKNQFNCLLVLGNNHHLLPLLQLWHPSHSGWCRRRDWSRFRLRKLLQTNQREGNSWSWRSGRDWDGLSFSFLVKKFPKAITHHHFLVCHIGQPPPPRLRTNTDQTSFAMVRIPSNYDLWEAWINPQQAKGLRNKPQGGQHALEGSNPSSPTIFFTTLTSRVWRRSRSRRPLFRPVGRWRQLRDRPPCGMDRHHQNPKTSPYICRK